MVTAAKLPIWEKASALDMANKIFGDGVSVINASYNGWSEASGIFMKGNAIAPELTPSDRGVILSTGRASDVTQSSGEANQSANTTTNTSGIDNDPDFNALAGANTYDGSVLEVAFIPTGTTYSLHFVYASEEYPEFVNSVFNDLVGVWVNDMPVDVAVGGGNSSIETINGGNNTNLYRSNTDAQFNTEMDGFTVTLSLKLNVVANETNTLRIGVADVADSNYDTNLLIAESSIQNEVSLGDDQFEVATNAVENLDVLENDISPSGSVLTITKINGVEVGAGDTVTLPTGQIISLNEDGTILLENDDDADVVNFTYTAETDAGATDTAFVTLTSIPCFVAGTSIATPTGPVRVEQLEPGDLILTRDNGPQKLRWIGRRQVKAIGPMVPICIDAGALGAHDRLLVSPQHRILLTDSQAEIYFGDCEFLVAAQDLVNGKTIRRDHSKTNVEYVHILFDRHQVIYSQGLATESFLPGPLSLAGFETSIIDEICGIFPQLDPETGSGYSLSTHPTLKGYEARVLLSNYEHAPSS